MRNKILTCLILLFGIPMQTCLDLLCRKEEWYDFPFRTRDKSEEECLTCIKFKLYNKELYYISCELKENVIDRAVLDTIMETTQKSEDHWLSIKNPLQTCITTSTLENIPDQIWDNIWVLYLSENCIEKISPGFFHPFSSLLELDLSVNNISFINDELLPLVKLQKLTLSQNNIRELNPDSLKLLINLFEIDLSYNKIKHIHVDLFKNQGHLETILINSNEIAKFDCIFHNMTPFSLPSLDLSWNEINELNLQGNFKTLDLNHNELTEFSMNLSSSFQALNLSHNNIAKISDFAMLMATNLLKLDLSNNRLSSLPTSSFRNQKSLKYIDISNNLLGQNKYGSRDNWVSFFLYSENLVDVSLANNMWTCTDLKDIIQVLNFRSIKVSSGNEHTKTNILGISCIDISLNNTVNNGTTQDIMSYLMAKISNEDAKHQDDKIEIESELYKMSSKINELESALLNLKSIIKSNDSNTNNLTSDGTETKNLDRVFSNIKRLEAQIGNISARKENSDMPDKQMLKITNSNISNLREIDDRIFTQNNEKEQRKTEPLFQTINVSTDTSEGIIQNILLLLMTCVLFYFGYMILRKIKVLKRDDMINLVQT